jgi:hypothetical protein
MEKEGHLMSIEDCARLLLVAQADHDRKMNEFADAVEKYATWDYSFLEVFDLCLDLLGVPADNTSETRACEIANETGEWPVGAFCRDYCYEKFDEMAVANGDVDGFIAAMKESIGIWAKEGIVR